MVEWTSRPHRATRLPFPRRNHVSLRPVVLSFLPQLSRRAGDYARARDPGLARSDSPMDAQFRRRVCTPPAETHRSLWRYVAPRRGVLQSQWRAGVSLARRGSGWGDPRCLVQTWRNAKAAKCFFRRLLKGLRYGPRATDKLSSY